MNNQKQKVLLVITKSNFGGAQKYILELAKGLKTRGFDVQIALGGNGVLIQKLEAENLEVIKIPYLGRDFSLLNDIRTFFALIHTILKNKPEVVHLNSSKIGGLGALAARCCFVSKIIFTVHGWAFNEDRNSISKCIIKFLYSITLILSTKVIAVSNITKDQAKNLPFYFSFKNKIITIHNGISDPLFLTREESLKFISSKISLDLKDKIIIGQIAELHPIKSIETTIRAAKDLVKIFPNLIFILIGDGEEKNKLQHLINTHNLNQNVFLLGFINNAAQYIKAFDILCLTSKSEALALVVLEAGLAQVPVIVSRVGGLPELIIEKETGFLFEAQNDIELGLKIKTALSLSETKKKELTDSFYKKIQEDFSINHMITKTVEAYKL